MSKAASLLNNNIDLQHSTQMIAAFSEVAAVPCTLLDENGDSILFETTSGHSFCAECKAILLCQFHSCQQLHKYSGRQSERFGGRYIYSCALGMSWIAAPVMLGGKMVASLSCGPIMIMDMDDFIASIPSLQSNISTDRLAQIRKLLHKFPHCSPEKLSQLSLQLLATALYVGDSSLALIEQRNKSEQYQSIGQYIQQYKVDNAPSAYPIGKEQELIEALSQGNEQDARSLLNELLGYIFFSTGGQYQAMRTRSLELMSILSRAVICGGADQEQVLALNQQFLLESDRLRSTDDLVEWLTHLITRYAGLVFKNSNVKRKDIFYNAINYIKHHLSEHITLEDTARQVGLSPNYFSKVFKDEMGCTFIYYLNKLRIERSKSLLLFSKLSIREICDAVGYEDQSYYIKTFARFTGVTPGKFRKRGGRLDISKERDATDQ